MIADADAGPSFAVIRPHSIALAARRASTGSSVRNTWPATIADIDRLGDRVRVGIDGELPLTAEITAAALDALALRPGDEITRIGQGHRHRGVPGVSRVHCRMVDVAR